MNARQIFWMLLLTGAVSFGWRAWSLFDGTRPLSELRPGDFPELPLFLVGACVHLVAFHGSCKGCEEWVKGRERAWWISPEEHPRDVLFPRVLHSERLYEQLRVRGIPVEFLISHGRVAYVGSPIGREPPECGTGGSDGG